MRDAFDRQSVLLGSAGDRGRDHGGVERATRRGSRTGVGLPGGGALHCAITDEVSCWGTGGSLLRGEASGPWFVPTAVPSPEPSDVSQLAVFSFLTRFATIQFGAHACALHVDGSVSCWGTNWTGELGNGTTDPVDAPSPVELPLEAVSVAVGTLHSCAVLADGSVHCWGANASGQLGTGSLADQLAPSRTILLPERP